MHTYTRARYTCTCRCIHTRKWGCIHAHMHMRTSRIGIHVHIRCIHAHRTSTHAVASSSTPLTRGRGASGPPELEQPADSSRWPEVSSLPNARRSPKTPTTTLPGWHPRNQTSRIWSAGATSGHSDKDSAHLHIFFLLPTTTRLYSSSCRVAGRWTRFFCRHCIGSLRASERRFFLGEAYATRSRFKRAGRSRWLSQSWRPALAVHQSLIPRSDRVYAPIHASHACGAMH